MSRQIRKRSLAMRGLVGLAAMVVGSGVLSIWVFGNPLAARHADQLKSDSSPVSDVTTFLFSRSSKVEIVGTNYLPLTVGVPVFGKTASGEIEIVGVVLHVSDPNQMMIVPDELRSATKESEYWLGQIEWTNSKYQPVAREMWQAHRTPLSLEWVASLMLPPERKEALLDSFSKRFEVYQADLLTELEPMLIGATQDILPILKQRFEQSVAQQQPAISALADRYQSEIFKERFVPLAKSDVLPIVREEIEPLLRVIGGELFQKASVWRFTWRYLYDKSPLPNRSLVESEFERFVQQDGIPIIESHTEELIAALVRSISKVSENERLNEEIRLAASELFHDPELRRIFSKIVEDMFADTAPLEQAIKKHWDGENGQRFRNNLQAFLEPWLNEAGREILGTSENGLTPEFVAALRTQILAKDRAWITVIVEPRTESLAHAYPMVSVNDNTYFPSISSTSIPPRQK